MSDMLTENDANSKPICHGSPHPLLELASMKVALTIWVTKFNEFYPSMKDSQRINELHFNTEISIAVPQSIQNMTDATLPLILWELQRWAGYMQDVPNNLTKDQIYTRFNLVAFGGNGTVNFKDSVANFLEDDSLDIKTRFQIACVNCAVEKIDRFWPLLSDTLNVDNLQFDNDFMLFYWIRRKRGELDRIPLQGFGSIEQLMMDKCRNKFIYLAIEYFFTSLNPNDRLVELEKLLYPDMHQPIIKSELFKYGEYGCFAHLFPSIDGPLQRQILDKYHARSFHSFVNSLKPIEYTVQCFLYMRDIIIPESYFETVIASIMHVCRGLSLEIHQFCGCSKEEEHYFHQRIEIILEQIWLQTPAHLKEYTLGNISNLMHLYMVYNKRKSRGFGRDIRFLLAMLSDASVQTRKYVSEELGFLIENVPPSQVEELIVLCFMRTEAIEEFKRTFPYSPVFHVYCSNLVFDGCFAELDEFFGTLYSNQDQVMEIKKNYFKTASGIYCCKLETVEKYANYIDNQFSNRMLAADFKDSLFSSDELLEGLFRRQISSTDNFHEIESMLLLFVSPQRLTEIKNKLLDLFRGEIVSGELHSFDGSRWSKFLTWCTDSNGQQMDDFMKSLQIDAVFETAFSVCLRYRPNGGDELLFRYTPFAWSHMINSLNRFLMWYFIESKDTFENYVREKVEYYERMEAAEVERIFGRDRQIVIDSMRSEWMVNFSEV